jgi:hypothetical protein
VQAGIAAFGKALIIQSSQAAPGTENRWCRRDLAGGYLTAPLWDQRRDEGLACLTLPQRASATYSGYDLSGAHDSQKYRIEKKHRLKLHRIAERGVLFSPPRRWIEPPL